MPERLRLQQTLRLPLAAAACDPQAERVRRAAPARAGRTSQARPG